MFWVVPSVCYAIPAHYCSSLGTVDLGLAVAGRPVPLEAGVCRSVVHAEGCVTGRLSLPLLMHCQLCVCVFALLPIL